MKKDALQLEDLKVSNLPELQGWKEKQQKLVEENPYVEIVDNKSYEVACKSRTALLKGRTELEKQDKLIASKLTSFRKEVKQETDNLIAITLPYEEKQQSEVKRFEEIKAAEKAEEKRIEQLRVDTIKSKINNFETASYGVIQDTTIENIDLHKSMLDAFANADFDYEEFDIIFEQAKARIQTSWDLKCADIQEKESQRVENERLQKEAEQARIVSELQASRLNELTPYIAYGEPIDLTNLHSIEESVWIEAIASKKALFEAEQKKQQEAQEKIEADKKNVFEIYRSRLKEIGFKELFRDNQLSDLDFVFTHEEIFGGYSAESVFDCSQIDFENILLEAKKRIEENKAKKAKAEEQRIADEKLAKEDAERLKKKNKAREKRLAKDKKVLKEFIENIYLSNKTSVFLSENEPIAFFDGIVLKKLHLLISELLTDLNNL
jgi:colicin import membrane protein